MPAEACFSVTAKGPGQELVTLRGDTWGELIANSRDAGVDVARLYAAAFGVREQAPAIPPAGQFAVPDESQAFHNVVQAFPQAAPVAQPVQQPQAAPSGGPSCAHGARTFKDTQTSKGQWKRWECAIPWQPRNDAGNAARCKPINA
jgi:hypothetical protein